MTFEELVEGLRASNRELQTEGRLVRAGLKQEQNTAAILERYAWLYSDASLRVAESAERDAEEADREGARRVRVAITQGLIERENADAQDALSTFFATAEVDLGQEGRLPFFTAQAELSRAHDTARRDRLGESCMEVMEAADPLSLRVMESTMRMLRQLGHSSYTGFWAELKGVDYKGLMAEFERAGAACADLYRQRISTWMESIGYGLGSCPHWHLGFFRGMSQHADHYSADRFEPAMRETFARLGVDLFTLRAVHIDLADRPAKNPRASVWVPEAGVEVHLLTRPQGGYLDYSAFLHEAGHALHFGMSDPALGWPLGNLGRSMAYPELWSFLVERIGHDPDWLQQALGVDAGSAERIAADLAAVDLMMYMRLTAKFAYELALYEGDPLDQARGRDLYSQVLSARTGFRYDPRPWQFDRDEGFYSADYGRAHFASAALDQQLSRMFGRPWWRRPEAGRWLAEQWKQGWIPEAEETVAATGGVPGSGDALVAVFRERLGDPERVSPGC